MEEVDETDSYRFGERSSSQKVVALSLDEASAGVAAIAFGPSNLTPSLDEKDAPGVLLPEIRHGSERRTRYVEDTGAIKGHPYSSSGVKDSLRVSTWHKVHKTRITQIRFLRTVFQILRSPAL